MRINNKSQITNKLQIIPTESRILGKAGTNYKGFTRRIGAMPTGRQGFTLLELLVVIGIIAILVGFATVSYSAAQVRARDARRKADLNSMKDALEQYYAANSFVYPGTCSTASTYLTSSWPVDPGSYSYTQTCAAASYCICAQMEAAAGGNSSNTACAWSSDADYFCVKNLQ